MPAHRTVATAFARAELAAVLGAIILAPLLAHFVTRHWFSDVLAGNRYSLRSWKPGATPSPRGSTASSSLGIRWWSGSLDPPRKKQPAASVASDDRRSEIRNILDQVRRGGKAQDHEAVCVSDDRDQLDVSPGPSCVKSTSGATIDAAAVAGQIASYELSAEMFRQAVEACSCGMVMIDGAGKIMMVNTRTERLFGYPREELIGQPADIIVPVRLRARHARYRADFIKHPESHTGTGVDLFGRRRDGTEFPIDVSLNPIDSAVGLLVLSVIVDLTERNQADRLKDEFVATVSHELRTPLTSIAGALGLLAGNATGNLPKPAARLIAIALSNSQRLVRLINDILDIGKMESGQIVFDLQRVEVLSLVEQAIEANRGFADSYDVVVQLDATSEKGEVRADPDRLVQVVTNLLSNAIKFSPRGGKVVVATARRNDVVGISVQDHGHGIPDEFKPRVFEKFAQTDASDTRQKGGSGLGLSIVKTIVERLGGTVVFHDAPGGGTIFQVELPDWEHGLGITSNLVPSTARASFSAAAPSA